MNRADVDRLRWAALWLWQLIEDGRIIDLDPDDESVRWAREAKEAARDRRRGRGPLSPEHRAAIAAGRARARWARRQEALARAGKPHELVPAVADMNLPGRPVRAGECHWCAFWGVSLDVEHIAP